MAAFSSSGVNFATGLRRGASFFALAFDLDGEDFDDFDGDDLERLELLPGCLSFFLSDEFFAAERTLAESGDAAFFDEFAGRAVRVLVGTVFFLPD